MGYGMAIKVHYNPDLVGETQWIAAPKFHKTTGGQTVNGTIATAQRQDVNCKVCLAKMAKMDRAVYLAATS
jgi:hypothetical protein